MSEIRLLSIEDDKNISHLIGKVATEMGFSVCVANDPEDIIPLYKSFKPHIVLLDILMPEKDGFEVLKFLGKRKSKAYIVILSGSAYNQIAGDMITGLNLNLAGNLTKPFRIETLRMMLAEVRFSIIERRQNKKSKQAKTDGC